MTARIGRISRGAAAICVISLIVACGDAGSPQAPPLAPPVSSAPGGGGACDDTEADAIDVVRLSSGGACRPADVMVLYRCSTTTAPVLRLSSGTSAVDFLGGPYAVSTDSLPPQVRFVGEGEGSEILVAHPATSPGTGGVSAMSGGEPPPLSEPLVYVRRGEVTERWLRLPARTDVQDPPVAWLIGDSILDGGREHVDAALRDWAVTLDAEVGRPSSAGISLAESAVEDGADVVLVELGTNDPSVEEFRQNLLATVEVLRGVPFVLWQTPKGPESEPVIREVSAAIRDAAPGYPNVALADWEHFVPAEDLETDGIHPDEGSERLESQLIAPLLRDWRDAVAGEGATACEGDVLRGAS